MNNWIPKNKIVMSATIMAALSVVLYFASLFIVLREIKKVENFYHDTESEFFKEKKFLAIKSIAEANKEPIQTLRNFFIQKGDEVKFIEQIEAVARRSAIKFEIVSIDAKANQPDPLKEDIEVKIGMEGSWKNIISFTGQLEKMSFGTLIKDINLNAKVPGEWSGFVSFIIFREK